MIKCHPLILRVVCPFLNPSPPFTSPALNSQRAFLLKVHNLPPDQLAKREVIMVDIANDPIDEKVRPSHSLPHHSNVSVGVLLVICNDRLCPI